MSDIDSSAWRHWLGIGFKSGGQLLFGGFEAVYAYMVNLGSGESFDLDVISSRWGFGLGGGGGAVAVLGFGFTEPYELQGKRSNDWGVSLAFTEKFISKSVMQSLVFAKHWVDIYKGDRALRAYGQVRQAFKDIGAFEQVRNSLHTTMAGLEASKRKGIVVLELPFAGVGLEASAYATRGKMFVSNSSDSDLADK